MLLKGSFLEAIRRFLCGSFSMTQTYCLGDTWERHLVTDDGSLISLSSNPVSLNLRVNIRYPAYRIFVLQFTVVAKLKLWSSNKNNPMVGVVLKGCSVRQLNSSFIYFPTISDNDFKIHTLFALWELYSRFCLHSGHRNLVSSMLCKLTWELTLIPFSFPPDASITDSLSNFSWVRSIPRAYCSSFNCNPYLCVTSLNVSSTVR